MAATLDEKTLLEKGTLHSPERHARGREHHHRFRKVIALLGLTFLVLWLVQDRFPGPHLIKHIHMDEARKQRIDTGSQSLDGDFKLFDLLSIRSTSGSISASIHPQPADKENPAQAEFLIRSHSGKVSVDFPAFSAPERDYRVSIDSQHGAIDGLILHGRVTSIVSQSASIEMQIIPYAADDYSSTLRTSSKSGMQEISLLSPANDQGVPIKRMSSLHSTGSGSLDLHYPKEWEGMIEGHTRSGSLELHGRDLEIIRQSSINKVGHYILAKKGDGNSTLNFHTLSGSVNVHFD